MRAAGICQHFKKKSYPTVEVTQRLWNGRSVNVTFSSTHSIICSHKLQPSPYAVFPHTLWLAPQTGFGNVCLQSLPSLHLEHKPGETPDLCAIRLPIISCVSAGLCLMCLVQLSVMCHWEARAVISAPDSPAIPTVFSHRCNYWLFSHELIRQLFSN